MCVDYRGLNKESPKDDFPDVLVNNTIWHALFSFIDGLSCYNQIQVVLEDHERPHLSYLGNLYFNVMLFDLKNAGRVSKGNDRTFPWHDTYIRVYMDNMIVKSMIEKYHLVSLKNIFERLRNMILNLIPTNVCSFQPLVKY